MSVSIGWRPDNPKKLSYIEGGSTFHGVLENAFGGFPFTLKDTDIDTLRGIYYSGFDGAEELISAIDGKGPIIVEAEW